MATQAPREIDHPERARAERDLADGAEQPAATCPAASRPQAACPIPQPSPIAAWPTLIAPSATCPTATTPMAI